MDCRQLGGTEYQICYSLREILLTITIRLSGRLLNDAMRTLDGVVPYSVLPGNHDIGTNGSANTRDTTLFNTYFPVSDFSGSETFGGVYPAEPDKYDNNYHTFHAGGTDWLVLSLEFGPRDHVLDWANEVVASHPNHRVIVVTHDYMYLMKPVIISDILESA